MKKVHVIANPFSGTSRKLSLKDQLLKKNNDFYNLEIHFTEKAGHAAELVDAAIAGGAEIIVAAGGDGTVNEVAARIMKHERKNDITFGILPGGSGNGFAMHLGLGRDTVGAFEFIKKAKTKLIDTCTVNDRFFINVSGIGFDAKIAYLTKKSSSRGFKRYFLATMKELFHFETTDAIITTDDGEYHGRYAAIIVANATMYGYNFTIAPTAALDDGLLDVILLEEASLYTYFIHSYRFLNKTLHLSPFAKTIKTSKVTIESKGQNHFHVDGEGFLMHETLNFEINPKSLKVIHGQ